MERVLKYIVASLDLDSPKASYIGVFLVKEHSVAWIAHIKQLAALAAQVSRYSTKLLNTRSVRYRTLQTILNKVYFQCRLV